jgi:hypothetical protein
MKLQKWINVFGLAFLPEYVAWCTYVMGPSSIITCHKHYFHQCLEKNDEGPHKLSQSAQMLPPSMQPLLGYGTEQATI